MGLCNALAAMSRHFAALRILATKSMTAYRPIRAVWLAEGWNRSLLRDDNQSRHGGRTLSSPTTRGRSRLDLKLHRLVE